MMDHAHSLQGRRKTVAFRALFVMLSALLRFSNDLDMVNTRHIVSSSSSLESSLELPLSIFLTSEKRVRNLEQISPEKGLSEIVSTFCDDF